MLPRDRGGYHYILNKHPAPGNRPLVLLTGPAWSANGHLVNHPNMLFLMGTVSVLPKTMVSVHPAHCSVDNKCYFTRNAEVTYWEMNGKSVS